MKINTMVYVRNPLLPLKALLKVDFDWLSVTFTDTFINSKRCSKCLFSFWRNDIITKHYLHLGWMGDLCDVPICRKGCDPLQGYCRRPGECRCKLGFYGDLCDKCVALPGCQHGRYDRSICNNATWRKCSLTRIWFLLSVHIIARNVFKRGCISQKVETNTFPVNLVTVAWISIYCWIERKLLYLFFTPIIFF